MIRKIRRFTVNPKSMRQTSLVLLLTLSLQECFIGISGLRPPANALPENLRKPTSKLDKANLNSFRNSLRNSEKPAFDEMNNDTSAFQLTGRNPNDIRRATIDLAKMGNRTRQMLANNNFTGLTASDVGEMTGAILGNLKSSSLDAMNAALDAPERAKVCKKLVTNRIPRIKRFIKKFQCLDILTDPNSNDTRGVSKSQMQALIEVLRENKTNAATWTSGEARMAVDSGIVKKDEIKSLTVSVVNSMINDGYFQKRFGQLPEGVIKALCAKVKQVYVSNDWGQLNKAKIAKLRGLIPKCPDAIDQVPRDAAIAAAKDLGKQAGSMTRRGRRKLADKFNSAKDWSLVDVKDRLEFIKGRPKMLKSLTDSNIVGLLNDSSIRQSLSQMKDEEANNMKNRIIQTADYKMPQQLGVTELMNLIPNIIRKLSSSYLKQVPCNAIAGSLTQFKDVKFATRTQKREIIRCKANFGINVANISKTQIESLGELMDGFNSEEIRNMPTAVISTAKSILAEIDFSEPNGKAILQRMRDNGDNLSGQCGSLGKLRKYMKKSEKDSCSTSDLGLDDTSKTPDLEGLDRAYIKKLVRSLIQSEGGLAGGSGKLSASNFLRLAKFFATGMKKSDIDDLPVDSDLPEKIEAVLADEDDMDSAVLDKFGQKLKDLIDYLGVTNLDSAIGTKIAKAFKYYKKMSEEFVTLTSSNGVRQTICSAMRSSSSTAQTQTQKGKVFATCLKFRPDSTDSTKVVDKSSGGRIESDDIQDLGNLLDGMRDEDVRRLDQTGVSSEDNIQRLCKANTKFSVKEILMTELRKISDLFTNKLKSCQLGGCTSAMTREDFNKISASDAEDICADLLADNEYEETATKKRRDRGFVDEMTDAENIKRRAGKDGLAQKCLPAIQANNNPSTTRRRKRATTTTLTCDDLTSLGSGVTGVTAEQIGTLSKSEFEACIEKMNQYSGWASDRRSAFTSKAKSSWGAVSGWTAEKVRLGGSIVASGLTEAEIGTLNLGTSEAASSVGATNYYTAAQLIALFNRYLGINNAQPSSLDSDRLSNLGNMACGATDTQIASFQNAHYKDAAGSFSKLNSCTSAQMVAYGNHAITAFGAVSSWDTSTVSTVGTMIGGVDVSQLDSDQLGALTAEAIRAIPSSTFKKFSPTQLSGFSSAQANAVTSSQQSELNSNQMTELTGAGATTKTSATGASMMTQASILLITVTTLINRL